MEHLAKNICDEVWVELLKKMLLMYSYTIPGR